MPTIHREDGFTFFHFSNEGDPREPVHVHVRKGSAIAKIWLEPDAMLHDSDGFSAAELRKIMKVIQFRQQQFIEAWHDHFG